VNHAIAVMGLSIDEDHPFPISPKVSPLTVEGVKETIEKEEKEKEEEEEEGREGDPGNDLVGMHIFKFGRTFIANDTNNKS